LRSFSKESQDPIVFTWKCPPEFKTLCSSTTSSSLSLKAADYSSIIPIPTDNDSYEIEIGLKKDRRIASSIIKLSLKKPLKPALEGAAIDLAALIVISPFSRGGSPELLVGVSYLDKTLNILDYTYYWTVYHFKNEAQYLNGRKEPNLKVLNEELLTGDNVFTIIVTDKTGKTYSKNYSYEKGRAPYGGSCVVSPSNGISMQTNFKFGISGWITNSEPMIYRIKYLNKDNVYIDISKGGFPDATWTTNMIPVAKDFIVEVIDSSGLSSNSPCSLKVKSNPVILSLESYLDGEFDPNNRLLLVEIYKSNKENLDPVDKDPSLNNKALDMIDYYMQNAGNIQQDLENIVARIMSISNQPFDKDKLLIVNNSIKIIVDNIDPLLQYIDKMQNVYRILDNIFKKASSMEELKNDKDLIDILQNYLNQLNGKLFTSIINGQGLLVANESYDTKMNKVSKLNVPTLALDYDSGSERKFNSNRSNRKRTKIRYLQNPTDQADCYNSEAAICIPPGNITSIMNSAGSNGIGFQGQLNKKVQLPIAEKQYSNSLDFELSAEAKNRKFRRLDVADLNIRFEIRLKMPVLNDTSVVREATCVQYDPKKRPDTSCESWYDTATNEVVCSCLKQGLTVNVLDSALSNVSKVLQFPSLSASLCKILFIKVIFFLN